MTEKAKLNWKTIDLSSGQQREMDGQRLVSLFAAEFEEDKAEQRELAAEMLATGDLVAVQSVELWTKDPETGEADQLVARESYWAELPKEQSDLVKAQMLADELTNDALLSIFR